MSLHHAPWGKTLKWTSALLVALAVVSGVSIFFLPPSAPVWPLHLAQWVLPVVVLGCVPFMVRSYEITSDAILIRRLGWTTRLDRAGLKSAEVMPKAMSRSIRTCGNGGGFSFTGWYWRPSLGAYRAFVTDLNRTVVLRYEKRRVVVSPEDPEKFVRDLTR